MKTIMSFLFIAVLLVFSGCSAFGLLSETGETSVETSSGDTLDCKTDLVACTKTCVVDYKGNKVTRVYPIKPEKCQRPE